MAEIQADERPGFLSRLMTVEPDASRVLRPNPVEITILSATLVVYILAFSYEGPAMLAMNYVGPAAIMIASAWGNYSMLKAATPAIWTPVFWFRFAIMVYFGLGSLVPLFVSDESRAILENFYLFFPHDLAKFNIVILVFVLVYWLAVSVILGVAGKARTGDRGWMPERSAIPPEMIGLVFLVVGVAVNLLVVIPADTGGPGGTGAPIAGAIRQLALVAPIGYYLLIRAGLQRRALWLFPVLAIGLGDSLIGIFLFNKTAAIFPLLVISIAFLYSRPSIGRIAALTVPIVLFYLAISPLATFGRDSLVSIYGNFSQGTLVDRAEIIASYSPEQLQLTHRAEQGAWMRLSYVNAGTFAVNQYDNGQPGDSYRNLLVVWIPRFIYPDKPVITSIGREFNAAVNGNDQSASSPTIPLEGYWNLGWPGVILAGLVVGAVNALWSLYTLRVIAAGAWHLFVVVLLGSRVGVRIDGLLVSDSIGPIAFGAVGHIALTFLNHLAPASAGRSRRVKQSFLSAAANNSRAPQP